ncbi:DUF4381 domain-containing protein [Agrobacterium bohemicum]|uniref:DUF4381 domain-containing protein n=1 Tax=Agrobacterium bohemicum TaxID=2052828 RepID=A0A135P877_9HYPH|nr:DUF4381 domain-containing protein [Agrobacterium bohemicum]KXG87558.1 hypothetical protein ATO67_18065 [Agrobacterium bohemicum]
MEPSKPDPALQTALLSLRDIVLPEPVSWLPQTWGWVLVAAVLTVGIVIAALRWTSRYRANAYRREALAMLEPIRRLLEQPATRSDGFRQLGELVKRTALAAWPRSEVASLSNEDWVAFLKDNGSTDTHALEWLLDDFEYHGRHVVAGLPSRVGTDVIVATRSWIESHDVSA